MKPVGLPLDELPEGCHVDPSGLAYVDAIILPITNPSGGDPQRLACPRTSQLIQADDADVALMARHGWRFWVRYTPIAGAGLVVETEPYVPLIRSSPFLNSDPREHP